MIDYTYKPERRKINTKLTFRILICFLVVLVIGILAYSLRNYNFNEKSVELPYQFSLTTNYMPIKLLDIRQDGMVLGTECKQLLIPITADQIFSISNGITKDFSRPLTHDIFKTTLEHFDINPTRFTIDKYENDLWYSTIRFQKGFNVLDLDIRPSDGVALSVRYNLTMYIDTKTFNEKAKNVC